MLWPFLMYTGVLCSALSPASKIHPLLDTVRMRALPSRMFDTCTPLTSTSTSCPLPAYPATALPRSLGTPGQASTQCSPATGLSRPTAGTTGYRPLSPCPCSRVSRILPSRRQRHKTSSSLTSSLPWSREQHAAARRECSLLRIQAMQGHHLLWRTGRLGPTRRQP